jgi:hypothetical protein
MDRVYGLTCAWASSSAQSVAGKNKKPTPLPIGPLSPPANRVPWRTHNHHPGAYQPLPCFTATPPPPRCGSSGVRDAVFLSHRCCPPAHKACIEATRLIARVKHVTTIRSSAPSQCNKTCMTPSQQNLVATALRWILLRRAPRAAHSTVLPAIPHPGTVHYTHQEIHQRTVYPAPSSLCTTLVATVLSPQ